MTYYVVSKSEGDLPELSPELMIALEATIPKQSKIFASKQELLDWLEEQGDD